VECVGGGRVSAIDSEGVGTVFFNDTHPVVVVRGELDRLDFDAGAPVLSLNPRNPVTVDEGRKQCRQSALPY